MHRQIVDGFPYQLGMCAIQQDCFGSVTMPCRFRFVFVLQVHHDCHAPLEL